MAAGGGGRRWRARGGEVLRAFQVNLCGGQRQYKATHHEGRARAHRQDLWGQVAIRAATPGPRAFIFCLENAVCNGFLQTNMGTAGAGATFVCKNPYRQRFSKRK